MPIKDLIETDVPFDRLSHLGDEMQKIADRPEFDDVRGIIFLADPEKGGIVMFGYDDTAAGVSDLLIHMKALFQSMGKGFGVMTDQGIMMIPED